MRIRTMRASQHASIMWLQRRSPGTRREGKHLQAQPLAGQQDIALISGGQVLVVYPMLSRALLIEYEHLHI
jgi:hypothetical protein